MIRLIALLDKKRGIAKNGDQPWHLPTDEKYFLEQTSKYGGVVLMGQTTYEVIGHPLKDRHNIILSRNSNLDVPGAEITSNLEETLNKFNDIWVIGGASIFAQTITKASELYLTQVDADANCDVFFPDYEQNFELKAQSEEHKEKGVRFRFTVWRRRSQ